jgi:solute carrier family 25 (mitochondrial carnitine/acylcarnitine transporter), member 20/29
LTSQNQLSLFQIGLAGAFSSIPTSFLIGPAEQIKIRLQIQETSLAASKMNAFTVATSIVKEGGLRALFRGTGLTFLRDVPTGFAYFATYEGLKRALRSKSTPDKIANNKQGTTPMLAIMFSGGVAGMVNWTLAIPIDTIKSRIQSSQTKKSIDLVVRELMAESGIKGFFRGLAPTLLRAFPASAALFFGVETSKALLDRLF